MPEGDTVHLAARRLDAALGGETVTRSDLRVPRLATVDLAGSRVREVVARGKHLLFRFDRDLTLHTHFRMDGSWDLVRAGRRARGPAHEIRAVLETATWTAVGRRLPVVELLPTADEARAVGHLGPDVLGPDWDPGEARRRLEADPDRTITDALLDQRVLAGVGNVYRCEICFLRGLHPDAPVGRVPDLAGVVALAHRLMDANRGLGRQVTTGDTRRGRERWVYGRAGLPCRRCGTPVRRAGPERGPEERVTFWCPACQPG